MDLRKRPEIEQEDAVRQKTIYMRRYRAKMKERRVNDYIEMKVKDKMRKRAQREIEKVNRLSNPALKRQARKKWADEKKKYRQKRKELSTVQLPSNTRKKTSRQRSRRHRSRQAAINQQFEEKKKEASIRTKRWRIRMRFAQRKENKTKMRKNESKQEDESDTPFTSRAAEYRALKRASMGLPHSPRKKAHIIRKLIASPRTESNLVKKGVVMRKESQKRMKMGETILKGMKNKIEAIKQRGTIPNEKKGAYQSLVHAILDKNVAKYHKFGSSISAYLHVKQIKAINQEWWKTTKRKIRKDRLNESVRSSIHDFYTSPAISQVSPSKQDVQNEEGELLQMHTMSMTLSDAYAKFKKDNADIKVGFSTFKKEKPRNVKIVSETSHRSCLCQICCNLALKINSLKKFAEENENTDLKNKLKNMNKSKMSDITLCTYTDLPAPKCLERSCEKCGPNMIVRYLEKDIKKKEKINWYKWEPVQIVDQTKNTTKRVTSCISKYTAMSEFLKELEKDLERFPAHIFRANWQHKQLQSCINNLKDGEVVILMDFSENYRCRYQKEAQNAFYDQVQVTVHPFMCYYKDPSQAVSEDNDETGVVAEDKLVKHSIIVISNDMKHDAYAVQQFEKEAMAILNKEVKVKKIIKFSDGCAAQYKGKISFAHLSESETPVIRNYFETSHGKSPCDGLGAIVKNACFRAVKSEKAVIGSAEAAFEYCKNNLQHEKVLKKGTEIYLSKRNMIYVDRESVRRDGLNVKTVAGTRNLHSARSINSPFRIEVRNLSCFCSKCNLGTGICENIEYVTSWEKKYISSTSKQACIL